MCVVVVPGIHGGGGEFFGVARTKGGAVDARV